MSELFKKALENISKETKEKIGNYLDFIELCVVQKQLREQGYISIVESELLDSDTLCYCFNLRYKKGNNKRLIHRLNFYYSLGQADGYWDSYEEALKKGIEFTLKAKEDEQQREILESSI